MRYAKTTVVLIFLFLSLFSLTSVVTSSILYAALTPPDIEVRIVSSCPMEGIASTIQFSMRNRGPQTLLNARVSIAVPSGWVISDSTSKSIGDLVPGTDKITSWNFVPGPAKFEITSLTISSSNFVSFTKNVVIPILKKIDVNSIRLAGEVVQKVFELVTDRGIYPVFSVGSLIAPISDVLRVHSTSILTELLQAYFTRDFVRRTPTLPAAVSTLIKDNPMIHGLAKNIYNGIQASYPIFSVTLTIVEALCWVIPLRSLSLGILPDIGTAELLSLALAEFGVGVSPEAIRTFARFMWIVLTVIKPIYDVVLTYPDIDRFLESTATGDSSNVNVLLDFLRRTCSQLVSVYSRALSSLSAFIREYINPIREWVASFQRGLYTIFSNAISWIGDKLRLLPWIRDPLTKFLTWLRDGVGGVLGFVVDLVRSITTFVSNLETSADGFARLMGYVPATATSGFYSLWKRLTSLAESAIARAKKAVDDSRTVIEWIRNLGHSIPDAQSGWEGASSLADIGLGNLSTDPVESLRASQASIEYASGAMENGEATTGAIRKALDKVKGYASSCLGTYATIASYGYSDELLRRVLEKYNSELQEADVAYMKKDYLSAIKVTDSLGQELSYADSSLKNLVPYFLLARLLAQYKAEGMVAKDLERELDMYSALPKRVTEYIASRKAKDAYDLVANLPSAVQDLQAKTQRRYQLFQDAREAVSTLRDQIQAVTAKLKSYLAEGMRAIDLETRLSSLCAQCDIATTYFKEKYEYEKALSVALATLPETRSLEAALTERYRQYLTAKEKLASAQQLIDMASVESFLWLKPDISRAQNILSQAEAKFDAGSYAEARSLVESLVDVLNQYHQAKNIIIIVIMISVVVSVISIYVTFRKRRRKHV